MYKKKKLESEGECVKVLSKVDFQHFTGVHKKEDHIFFNGIILKIKVYKNKIKVVDLYFV